MSQPENESGYESFEAIHRRYQPEIYALILSMVEDPDIAEDLTVETFVNAYRHWDRIRGEFDVEKWLHDIATNNVKNWRKQHGDSWQPLANDAERLARAVAALPEEYQPAFLLNQEDLSYAEIAERLGLSVPAVKTRLHRARYRISRHRDESEGEK